MGASSSQHRGRAPPNAVVGSSNATVTNAGPRSRAPPPQQQQQQQQSQQQQRPAGGYPGMMRQPVHQQHHPMAAPAPAAPNAAAPRDAMTEGQKIKQLATVDRKSVRYEPDLCLLAFQLTCTGRCSYEIHTGVRESVRDGQVQFTPNRSKPMPTSYFVDTPQDGSEMLLLLDEEVPQMKPEELTYNRQFAKYWPCVLVLRWEGDDGTAYAEHTFVNLGRPTGTKPEGFEQTKAPSVDGPGYVYKQLLAAKGNVYLVESLFGADGEAGGDVVVAAVAEGSPAPEDSPANGDVTATRLVGDEDEDEDGLCVICISEPKDTCVIPCRHLCLCKGCATELQKHSPKCPVCRQPIQQLLHMA